MLIYRAGRTESNIAYADETRHVDKGSIGSVTPSEWIRADAISPSASDEWGLETLCRQADASF